MDEYIAKYRKHSKIHWQVDVIICGKKKTALPGQRLRDVARGSPIKSPTAPQLLCGECARRFLCPKQRLRHFFFRLQFTWARGEALGQKKKGYLVTGLGRRATAIVWATPEQTFLISNGEPLTARLCAGSIVRMASAGPANRSSMVEKCASAR